MNLTSLALRNLRRRPIRTGLSILGIGLAVGSALALISLSRSIKDSTREGLNEMGDDLVVTQKAPLIFSAASSPSRRSSALPPLRASRVRRASC